MSKVLLGFATSMGSRTVVAEIGDRATAQAVMDCHRASGGFAYMTDEMPRISMRDHMAKAKREKRRRHIKVVSVTPSNVTALDSRRGGLMWPV